jgi:hypothetical protein
MSFGLGPTPLEQLISKAVLGLEYLEDADRLSQPERRWRCIHNAREALLAVQNHRSQQELSPAQNDELDVIVTKLQQRLSGRRT